MIAAHLTLTSYKAPALMIFGLLRPTPHTIDTVEAPEKFSGALGLVACPGIRIGQSPSRKTPKILNADLEAIKEWQADGIITLVEDYELTMAKVEAMPVLAQEAGLWWKHLPIIDMHIPEQMFENQWREAGADIRARLSQGERIIIHCYAGLGRTGLLAAKLLVEFGIAPAQAVDMVREIDPRRIQNKMQESYVLGLK